MNPKLENPSFRPQYADTILVYIFEAAVYTVNQVVLRTIIKGLLRRQGFEKLILNMDIIYIFYVYMHMYTYIGIPSIMYRTHPILIEFGFNFSLDHRLA